VIRAFVAVRIDPGVAQRICEAQSQLEKSLRGIRWVKRENLHLTLKFLGDIGDDKLVAIAGALERLAHSQARFSFASRGLGVFPDIKRARVLWVGLEGEPLARLAKAVEEAIEPIGFARERQGFKPHLTIGRWRTFDGRPELLRQEIERWHKHDFGASRADEVIFFQSVLKSEGAAYTPLRVFPLGERPG